MIRFSLSWLAALTCCACSTHPLQEQATQLSTRAIVDQIRCEARRAVLDYAIDADVRREAQQKANDRGITIYELKSKELMTILDEVDEKRASEKNVRLRKPKLKGRAEKSAARDLCTRLVYANAVDARQVFLDECNKIDSKQSLINASKHAKKNDKGEIILDSMGVLGKFVTEGNILKDPALAVATNLLQTDLLAQNFLLAAVGIDFF